MEFLKSVKFLSPAVFEMTVDNDATNFPIELKDENSQTQVFYLKNSGRLRNEVDMYQGRFSNNWQPRGSGRHCKHFQC